MHYFAEPMKKIMLTLTLFMMLIGCQNISESKVRMNGSTIIPRNHREKLIFDYFNVLKEKRYSDAYNMRTSSDTTSSPIGLKIFKEEHTENHIYLATEISIGKETIIDDGDDQDYVYHYIVYASQPHHTTLISGELTVHCKSNAPKTCLIGYNSAFGSAP